MSEETGAFLIVLEPLDVPEGQPADEAILVKKVYPLGPHNSYADPRDGVMRVWDANFTYMVPVDRLVLLRIENAVPSKIRQLRERQRRE